MMDCCFIVAYDFEGNEYVFPLLPYSVSLAVYDLLEDYGLDVCWFYPNGSVFN